MLTIDLGPFALAVPNVLLLASLALALLTGWWTGRRNRLNPERQLFRLLLVALLVARLAFVLTYLAHFREAPWRVLDIRDGGFIAWPGVLVAVLLGAWMTWRNGALRRPLGAALAVGVLSWGLSSFALQAFEQGTRLPELGLRDLAGRPVALQDYVGQPLVVNLWATWCPPCRREMPVLAEAQHNLPEVTFLFVNQGESEGQVAEFLGAQGLSLAHVLLDSGGRLGQHIGSSALPTTLFYDAKGRQIGSHLGELSRASLARALETLDSETPR
ncbi:TlpA disulfide reductase family protein [Pseudomonas sp.]|uniref:TlpA family protein disulfide reductase n=1 Tax=Pseudomonas sp. TaxID=306 RepID=UPI0028A8F958|nr:TlpA disulfide reductase family protein [Pseudomonas sp.]